MALSVWPSSAQASTSRSSPIHLDGDGTFQRGETVRASYSSCAGNQLVRVWLSSDKGRISTLVGYVVTEKSGRFSTEFEVPWATALGTAEVIVDCINSQGGNQHGSAVIEIIATEKLSPLAPTSPLTPLSPSTPLTPLQPLSGSTTPVLTPLDQPPTDSLASTGLPKSAQFAAVLAGGSTILGLAALWAQRLIPEMQARRRRRLERQ